MDADLGARAEHRVWRAYLGVRAEPGLRGGAIGVRAGPGIRGAWNGALGTGTRRGPGWRPRRRTARLWCGHQVRVPELRHLPRTGVALGILVVRPVRVRRRDALLRLVHGGIHRRCGDRCQCEQLGAAEFPDRCSRAHAVPEPARSGAPPAVARAGGAPPARLQPLRRVFLPGAHPLRRRTDPADLLCPGRDAGPEPVLAQLWVRWAATAGALALTAGSTRQRA